MKQQELIDNTRYYSSLNFDLINFLINNSSACYREINLKPADEVKYIYDESWLHSPWPIIIGKQHRAQFDKLVGLLPSLLYKAVKDFFQGDKQAFTDYLGWPSELYNLLLAIDIDPGEIMSRYDLIFTNGEIKFLELNIGSTCGGLYLDWLSAEFEPLLEPVFKEHIETDKVKLSYHNIAESFFQFIVQSIIKRKSKNVTGNILYFVIDNDPCVEYFKEAFQAIYAKCRPAEFSRGKIIWVSDFDKFEFSNIGEVSVDGVIIDAVILPGYDDIKIPDSLIQQLSISYVYKHIAFPDSPFHALLGSKILFALLHEWKNKSNLTTVEKLLIEKHIPWTVRLIDGEVSWQNKHYSLSQLLIENKDSFVLKLSNSSSGKDVLIGNRIDQYEWQKKVNELLNENYWIAQEYCPPDQILTTNGKSAVMTYEAVWGVFGMDNQYGGGFVRACPPNTENGTINAAHGATIFLVFEEEKTQSDNSGKIKTAFDNNRFYSPFNQDLAYFFELHTGMREQAIDITTSDVPVFMQDYQFNLGGAWPFFISRKNITEFNRIIKNIPVLFLKIIKEYFDGDKQLFSQILGWPPEIYSTLKHFKLNPEEVEARFDIIYSNHSPKVIEINAGSASHGWVLDWLAFKYQNSLLRYPATAQWNTKYRIIFKELMLSVIHLMKKLKTGPVQGNIFLYDFNGPPTNDSLLECLQTVYNAIKPAEFSQGNIFLFSDFNKIQFAKDASVFIDDIKVNALLFTLPPECDVPEEIYKQLAVSHLAGQLVFPDNPFFLLLGNKLLFALAHEMKEQGRLNYEDSQLVDQYIPWTARMVECQLNWRGQNYSLTQLLKTQQELFVLKKCDSYGGLDVIIGKTTDAKIWCDFVDNLMNNKSWLVQQYYAPDPVLVNNREYGMAVHEFIWGAFGFCEKYQGAFIRALPSENSSGVINSTNGSMEFLVFEEC